MKFLSMILLCALALFGGIYATTSITEATSTSALTYKTLKGRAGVSLTSVGTTLNFPGGAQTSGANTYLGEVVSVTGPVAMSDAGTGNTVRISCPTCTYYEGPTDAGAQPTCTSGIAAHGGKYSIYHSGSDGGTNEYTCVRIQGGTYAWVLEKAYN